MPLCGLGHSRHMRFIIRLGAGQGGGDPSYSFKAQSAAIAVSQFLDDCRMDHLLLGRPAATDRNSTGGAGFEIEFVASAPGLVDMRATAHNLRKSIVHRGIGQETIKAVEVTAVIEEEFEEAWSTLDGERESASFRLAALFAQSGGQERAVLHGRATAANNSAVRAPKRMRPAPSPAPATVTVTPPSAAAAAAAAADQKLLASSCAQGPGFEPGLFHDAHEVPVLCQSAI